MTSAIAALLLVGVMLAPGAERSGNRHFVAAEAAFRAERWSEAADEFAAAHALDPRPEYLYAQAQAERMGGWCDRAVTTYERFLAEDPPDLAANDARANIRKCEAELAAQPTPASTEVSPPPSPTAETSDDDLQPSTPTPADDVPAWYRDPWGGVLTWTGVALAGTGAALLGEAHRRQRRSQSAQSEQAYRDTLGGAPLLSRVGIGLLAAGGVALVTGIIRYATVGKPRARNRATKRARAFTPLASVGVGQRSTVGFAVRW
jgi:hypothetical protein